MMGGGMLSRLMVEGPERGPQIAEPDPWDTIAEALIDGVMNGDLSQVKCVLKALHGEDEEY